MEPTRRSFLIKASAGAAGTAAVLGAGLALTSAASSGDEALRPDELAELDQPVLVEIPDARRGEVKVLVGTRAVTFTDRDLVAKVLRATRRDS